MDINVHHYFHDVPSNGDDPKFDQILQRLQELGDKMSALSDAVDAALASEADEDAQYAAAVATKDAVIAELQAQLAQASADLTTAMANDQADAQTIADKEAQLAAQAAEIQAQIDRLNEAFGMNVPGAPETIVQMPVEEVNGNVVPEDDGNV